MATNEEPADKESVATYLVRTLTFAGKAAHDEQEALWESSIERTTFFKHAKIIGITSGVFFVLVGISIGGLMALENRAQKIPSSFGKMAQSNFLELAIASLSMSFLMMCAIASILLIRANYRNKFNRNYRLGLVQKLNASDGQLAANAIDGKLDLPSLWARTQERISTYHSIATDQAEASFKTGKRFAIGGFFIIVLAGLGAIFAPNTAATIAAGGVAAVAAAMTSYIGATFMKAQSEASAQLREFFNQPVEFSRVLSIERLIETLDERDRPAAVQDVIRSMMPSGSSLSRSDGE